MHKIKFKVKNKWFIFKINIFTNQMQNEKIQTLMNKIKYNLKILKPIKKMEH